MTCKPYIAPFLFLTLLFIAHTSARSFSSRDAVVTTHIEQCQRIQPSLPSLAGESDCQQFLKCGLEAVDAATAARWSAGASILAFIPTIAALLSNSIDEVLTIAEDSIVLAAGLALCSITVLAPRFGVRDGQLESTAAIKELLDRCISESIVAKPSRPLEEKALAWALKYREWQRQGIFAAATFVLMCAGAAVWYPAVDVSRYGVVVLSCGFDTHVLIWIGLTQLTVAVNVLARRMTTRTERIVLNEWRHKPTSCLTGSVSGAAAKATTWSRTIVLRQQKTNFLARSVRALTSILSLALYAFSTGILGSMTMFPASDAIRTLVTFAAAAALGRSVGSWALAREGRWKHSMVVDVVDWQMEPLRQYVEDEAARKGCWRVLSV